METRANYILIGAFTLLAIFGALTFVYWFERITPGSSKTGYRVVFEGQVSGLRPGAPVTFNGVRVGEVTRVEFNPTNSRQVFSTVLIDAATPVRKDTTVSLEFQGLTGIATMALRGGTNAAGRPTETDGDFLVLIADATSTQDVTESARTALKRVDNMLAENEATIKNTLKNLETFSATLTSNTERLDRILGTVDRALLGIEKLTGNADKRGELSETLETFRNVANAAAKDWHALAVDGRRAINTADQVFRNIDRNPSRLIFGGSSSSSSSESATPTTSSAPPRRPAAQQPRPPAAAAPAAR